MANDNDFFLPPVNADEVLPAEYLDVERQANPRRSRNIDFDLLREQFPFLPISPPIHYVNSMVATSQTRVFMPVPDGAQMVRFNTNQTAICYISTADASDPNTDGDRLDGTGSMLLPVNEWIYCKGTKSFSLYAGSQGVRVTAQFYIQS